VVPSRSFIGVGAMAQVLCPCGLSDEPSIAVGLPTARPSCPVGVWVATSKRVWRKETRSWTEMVCVAVLAFLTAPRMVRFWVADPFGISGSR